MSGSRSTWRRQKARAGVGAGARLPLSRGFAVEQRGGSSTSTSASTAPSRTAALSGCGCRRAALPHGPSSTVLLPSTRQQRQRQHQHLHHCLRAAQWRSCVQPPLQARTNRFFTHFLVLLVPAGVFCSNFLSNSPLHRLRAEMRLFGCTLPSRERRSKQQQQEPTCASGSRVYPVYERLSCLWYHSFCWVKQLRAPWCCRSQKQPWCQSHPLSPIPAHSTEMPPPLLR